MHVFELAIAGLTVGTLVGLTGMGGGALMTPLLVLGFGIAPTAAVGSDLAVSLAMKPVGALVHHRAGTVQWELVKWLLPTAVPAAFVGAFGLSLVDNSDAVQEWLRWGIGAALIAGVIGMSAQRVLARRRAATVRGEDNEPMQWRPRVTLLIGLIGGLVVGFTSVGSGSLIIVMLLLTHPRLTAGELVGTDLVQAIPLVGAATLGHLLFGEVHMDVTFGLLLGAIPGAYIGARLATRLSSDAVKPILSVVLLGSALALWNVPVPIMFAICGFYAVAILSAMWLDTSRRRARGVTTGMSASAPEKLL